MEGDKLIIACKSNKKKVCSMQCQGSARQNPVTEDNNQGLTFMSKVVNE